MTARRMAVIVAGTIVPIVMAAYASAQAVGSAEAAELFKQGRAALGAKDYATACPKFVASLQLERAVGTLISLADCEQATGKLASSRQHWQEAADFADASHDVLNRGAYARKKFAEIDRRVPKLIVHLLAGAPRDTSVRRDDVDLGASNFDSPMPVDPGRHGIVATARNHNPRTFSVDLKEGEQKTVEVGPGAETEASSSGPPIPTMSPTAPAPGAADGQPPPASVESRATSQSALQPIGLVTAGLGVVGLGVGGFFGLQAMSKKSDAGCSADKVCPNDAAANTFRDATSDGNLSTIFFVAGGVLAAGGLTLWLIAPKGEGRVVAMQAVPSVGMRSTGMALVGRW